MKSGITKMREILDECYDAIAVKAAGMSGQVELCRIIKLLSDKARSLEAEEQAQKPTAPKDYDDAQKRYYNECARNSVLYNLCGDLISALEQHDPNHPILEQAEMDMEKNGFSFGKPKPTAPAGLVEELREYLNSNKGIDQYDDIDQILSRYESAPKDGIVLSPYETDMLLSPYESVEPLESLAKRKGRSIALYGELISMDGRLHSKVMAREFLNTLPDKEAR